MPLVASASEACCQGFCTSQLALEPSVPLLVSFLNVVDFLGGGLAFFEEAGLVGGFAGRGVVLDPAGAEAGWDAPCLERIYG